MGLLWSSSFFFYLCFASFLVASSATLTVAPSNNSLDLDGAQSRLFLVRGSELNQQPLAPLTDSLLHLTDSALRTFQARGSFVKVTADNPFELHSSQIACISCDSADYSGELGPGDTLNTVASQNQAAAILLYSSSASHCTLRVSSDDQLDYRNIFTFNALRGGAALQKAFGTPTNNTASIVSMSFPSGNTDGMTGGTSDSGDSPNTAMIILYSITGIITALFLGIIITGAVRAHRHPERYGPRRVAGRPRQSRARGIARAMLETIPIVKFGDNEDGVAAAKRDVEMSMHPENPAREHSPRRSDSISDAEHTTTPRETEMPTTASDQPTEQPTAAAPASKPDAAADGGNFSCPICTDDFIKGQDLRVLPCNHQFHPECIDPWLINVSGTCPLCRIDLNPPKTDENGEEGENAEQTEETPAEGTTTSAAGASQPRHNRLTNYLHGHGSLNARGMRHATVEERLAALRRVREENQETNEDGVRPNRTRLTTRLRDRFRIRTRPHGVNSSAETSGTSTPTVPPPAHTAPTTDGESRT
ncbi:Zinc finger RING-type [Penicillium argentinense]|uniref:Zinc finger RING-type n=1 Tax=Penicillium argentinense TaxID=1131581 RepID=A0A9W9KN92_9EURO|nr:Zinc finger RING-type [Penicillium argentinense]KAJ5112365.1 Zinc finger RING-type [Penicillium argentinense]